MLFNCEFYNFVAEPSIEELNMRMRSLSVMPKHYIRRGFALIIVNEDFSRGIENLPGTRQDKKNILQFCTRAGFTIHSETETKNLTFFQMISLFDKMSRENFDDNDAFICFISSHGNAKGIVGTDGRAINIDEIVDPIVNNSTLISKPKLFFFNSCRGDKENIGQPARKSPKEHEDKSKLSDNDSSFTVVIPSHADTIISYSSWEGFKSFAHRREGSWFITVLTNVLTTYGNTRQLTDMLIMVNQLLADMGGTGEKQMPCFTCSLLRPVFFNISSFEN